MPFAPPIYFPFFVVSHGLVEQFLKKSLQLAFCGVIGVVLGTIFSLLADKMMATRAKKTRKRTKQGVTKQYKVINWAEYNQALVDRGSFTLWISEEVIKQWRHER